MAAPAYVEANARVAIPTRLRPDAGGTLDVLLIPRPPLTTATLANASQSAVASIQWIDDDGGGHIEPLWLASAPPSAAGYVGVDRYGGTFARGASSVSLDDGQPHVLGFAIAGVAGPGGALLADTDELRAMGGVVWFDHNGTLGHVKAPDGSDLTVGAMADMIDAGTIMAGQLDTTDPAHPALALSVAAASRRRAVLGDLVPAMGSTILTLTEVNANEIDVTGTAPVPPPDTGPDPFRSGLTVEELARSLSVQLPTDPGNPVRLRLELAVATADDAIRFRQGRLLMDDWEQPLRPGVKVAAAQIATRVYRASDVTFGLLQTELGTAYTGRWVTPEVELALLGTRKRWGVA
jgi:hypothetical protein